MTATFYSAVVWDDPSQTTHGPYDDEIDAVKKLLEFVHSDSQRWTIWSGLKTPTGTGTRHLENHGPAALHERLAQLSD